MVSGAPPRRTVIWLFLAGTSRISIRPSASLSYQALSSARLSSLAECAVLASASMPFCRAPYRSGLVDHVRPGTACHPGR